MNTTNLPADFVLVPRLHLTEWARLLEGVSPHEDLPGKLRNQMATTAEDLHCWASQQRPTSERDG